MPSPPPHTACPHPPFLQQVRQLSSLTEPPISHCTPAALQVVGKRPRKRPHTIDTSVGPPERHSKPSYTHWSQFAARCQRFAQACFLVRGILYQVPQLNEQVQINTKTKKPNNTAVEHEGGSTTVVGGPRGAMACDVAFRLRSGREPMTACVAGDTVVTAGLGSAAAVATPRAVLLSAFGTSVRSVAFTTETALPGLAAGTRAPDTCPKNAAAVGATAATRAACLFTAIPNTPSHSQLTTPAIFSTYPA